MFPGVSPGVNYQNVMQNVDVQQEKSPCSQKSVQCSISMCMAPLYDKRRLDVDFTCCDPNTVPPYKAPGNTEDAGNTRDNAQLNGSAKDFPIRGTENHPLISSCQRDKAQRNQHEKVETREISVCEAVVIAWDST